ELCRGRPRVVRADVRVQAMYCSAIGTGQRPNPQDLVRIVHGHRWPRIALAGANILRARRDRTVILDPWNRCGGRVADYVRPERPPRRAHTSAAVADDAVRAQHALGQASGRAAEGAFAEFAAGIVMATRVWLRLCASIPGTTHAEAMPWP